MFLTKDNGSTQRVRLAFYASRQSPNYYVHIVLCTHVLFLSFLSIILLFFSSKSGFFFLNVLFFPSLAEICSKILHIHVQVVYFKINHPV